MDRVPLIWSAPPFSSFDEFRMRGGAFPLPHLRVVSRLHTKAPPRMQQSPNAYRGGALQIGALNPN